MLHIQRAVRSARNNRSTVQVQQKWYFLDSDLKRRHACVGKLITVYRHEVEKARENYIQSLGDRGRKEM